MALAADEGYFQRRHRGALIFDRKDVVVAVARDAVGRQRIAMCNRFSVQRFGKQVLLAGVTRAALYGRRLRVWEIFSFQIGMATGAPEAGMYGRGKFLSVHVQRNRSTASCRGRALVAVAGEAFRSRLVGGADRAFGNAQGENRGEERCHCNSQTRSPLFSRYFYFSHAYFFAKAYFTPSSVRTFGFSSPTASRLWHAEQSLVMVWPSLLV